MGLISRVSSRTYRTTMSNNGESSNTRPARSSSPGSGNIRQLVADQFRDTMMRAFWDLMYEQLSASPPNMETAFQLLNDVKKGLLSLLPRTRKTTLHEQIELHLNFEALRAQAENDALDISDLLGKVLVILGSMCAPARDDNLKEIKSDLENLPASSDGARNQVTIFKALLGFIDLMQRDQQQLMQQQVNPIDLHRAQFQAYLSSGGKPDVVIGWLKEARLGLPDEQKQNVKAVFLAAFSRILNLPNNSSLAEAIPDEFLERVRMFNVEMKSISLLTSIVLLIKQACGTASAEKCPSEAVRGILSDPGKNPSIQTRLQNVSNYVEQTYCQGLPEQSQRSLKTSINDLSSENAFQTHPVLKLVNERVTKFCVQSFECASEKRVMPQLPGVVVSSGCANDVGYVATDFVNILLQNFVTFEQLYTQILRKIETDST